ncbi:MAG TPA: MarR family transcriptional regulator [Solimonas sp.]|nr:MarR family transcriptional regulator [Solimonas sp.]
MELSPTSEKFVLHWGEMGARWGVNRTQGQIHALLYLADQPMAAEEIAETLGVARSNVSTSLKELQNWGLVKIVHRMGDRRDLFVAIQDRWEILRLVTEGRKKREIDPTLGVMRECVRDVEKETSPGVAKARMQGMLEFLETLTKAYDQLRSVPPEVLLQLTRMAAQMQSAKPSKKSASD